MAVLDNAEEIARAAYREAWHAFNNLSNLTPDEKAGGPAKLRATIQKLVATGERDPEKIAAAALGLMREHEQIARSRARVASPGIASEIS